METNTIQFKQKVSGGTMGGPFALNELPGNLWMEVLICRYNI